jgi:hypothetical protein
MKFKERLLRWKENLLYKRVEQLARKELLLLKWAKAVKAERFEAERELVAFLKEFHKLEERPRKYDKHQN